MPKKIKTKIKKSQHLNEALQYYNSGNLRQAEMACGQALKGDPGNPEALHLAGLIAGRAGRYDDAIDFISKAVRINPSKSSYHNNLGLALRFKNRTAEAIESFKKAIELKPDFAGAFNNIGIALSEMRREDEAMENFKKALTAKPDYAEAYFNLGRVYARKGLQEEAADNFKKALALKPDHAEGYFYLGMVLKESGMAEEAVENYRNAIKLKPDNATAYNCMGNILAQKGSTDEALECYKKALELSPDYADAYNNLGNALADKGQLDEAAENYKTAMKLKPDFAKPYYELANIFFDKGMMEDAIENYKKAIALKPDFAEAYNNLGLSLENKNLIDESIEAIKKAISLRPGYAEAHYSLGAAYILLKDFKRGWDEYEWRLKTIKVSPLAKPGWDGSSLEGKVIIVYAEQGYGDTLQFVRYLPLLYDEFGAKKVLFVPYDGLEQLLRESDLKAEILDHKTSIETLEFDTNIHLMSLPMIFKTNLDNIPFKQKRYLKANQDKVKSYREKFFTGNLRQAQGDNDVMVSMSNHDRAADTSLMKVGIFWQGSPAHKGDRNRSLHLKQFYPLCRLPGIKLYSLQKGLGIEQLNNLPDAIEIINLGETFNDFSDTAAAIENMDMVISIDSAVAHLSGALGKKTWILLPPYAEWRWFLNMDYSPWYEDVKLFRHKEPGKKNWEEMMRQVKVQVQVEEEEEIKSR